MAIIVEGDKGKGEDDPETDSSEENLENLLTASPHPVTSDHLLRSPDDDGPSETDLDHAAEDSLIRQLRFF